MKQQRCNIIIVNWNVAQLLERCLHSLAQYCTLVDSKVVVVDNNSSDNSVAIAKRAQRSILKGKLTIITNRRNVGFASAVMTGFRRLVRDGRGSDPVLLLNPDIELHAEALSPLIALFDSHPRIGVIGPTLFDDQGVIQRSVMRLPGVFSTALLCLKFHHLIPWLPPIRRYFAMDHDYTAPAAVEQVQGAFFLVRPECWRQLDGLDPRFFLWYEEVDFCKRARDAGWEVRYQPIAGIIHHGGKSFAQEDRIRKHSYFYQSALYYLAKHKGFWGWFILWLLQPLSWMVHAIAGTATPSRRLWVVSQQ